MAPAARIQSSKSSRRGPPAWMQLSKGTGLYGSHRGRAALHDRYGRAPERGRRFGLLTSTAVAASRAWPPPDSLWSGAYASAAAGAYQFLPATWRCGTSSRLCLWVWTCQPGSGRPRFCERRGACGSDDRGSCLRSHPRPKLFARMVPPSRLCQRSQRLTGSRPKPPSASALCSPADAGNQRRDAGPGA